MNVRLPLNRWVLTGLVVAISFLVAWEWIALIGLAKSASVWYWIRPIPAVATSGVMLASTALHMTYELDQRIRSYAGWLAAAGIFCGILGTATQHYIEAAHVRPDPWLALPVGGIPVCMGGLLVHLLAMVFAQRQRELAAAEANARAKQERERETALADAARLARVASEETAHNRALARQRELAAEAKRTADEVERQAAAAERLRVATAERAEVARKVLAAGKPHLVVDNTARGPKFTDGPVGKRAVSWLIAQHHAGIPLDAEPPDSRVGPRAIAEALGAKYETCRQTHRAWKATALKRISAIADLEEAAG